MIAIAVSIVDDLAMVAVNVTSVLTVERMLPLENAAVKDALTVMS
jgi:hypothetical protein